jgi:hypothetical protein
MDGRRPDVAENAATTRHMQKEGVSVYTNASEPDATYDRHAEQSKHHITSTA